MKKIISILILLFIFLIIGLSWCKAQIGVTGFLNAFGGVHPTHLDSLGGGGFMTIKNAVYRDLIPSNRRKAGMWVQNSTGDSVWVLGTNLTTWTLKTFGSGSGTVTNIATTSPITGGPITTTGTIAINNAAADGSTKGAASFTAADFDATTGNISLDYTNGQAASGSLKGFLSSADWTTFNNKVSSTRAINTTSPITGGGDLSADRTIAINNAAADGSTKGAASFAAADFNASSGNISIDYTNGQVATNSVPGFLSAADHTTYSALVTNATHTGEVTGATTLTVDKTAITNKTNVTAASGDKILIADVSDADNLKYVTAGSIANLATAYTDEQAQDAVGVMIDGSLTYVDGTPLLQRSALTGAITATAGSNTTSLGSFTKSQLDGAVSDGNVLYVGDVTTNATHTGEVTGATTLTADKTIITNRSLVTVAGADKIMFADASNSDALARTTAQDIANLAPSSMVYPSAGIAVSTGSSWDSPITNSAGIETNLSDETGTGLVVMNDSPSLVTPNLGTPSAVDLDNATDVPFAEITGSFTAGDIPYANSTTGLTMLPIGTAGKIMGSTGSAPAWVTSLTGFNLITCNLDAATYQTSNAVSAAGTTQGTATAITSDYNVVTTVAANTGVILPTIPSNFGRRIIIVNKGANALRIYPQNTGQIDALGTNVYISLPVGEMIMLNASSATQWYSSYNWSVYKADELRTARTLNGTSFNGSANITVPANIDDYYEPLDPDNGSFPVLWSNTGGVDGNYQAQGSKTGLEWNPVSGDLTVASNIYAPYFHGASAHLMGGSAADIPYQTSADNTAFIPIGSPGQVLKVNASSVPVWDNVSGTGTVTNTGGNLTANSVVLGAGAADSKVVAGITTDGTSQLNLGVAGTSVGKLQLRNATSGSITIQPTTGALGAITYTALATTGNIALHSVNNSFTAAQSITTTGGSSSGFSHTASSSSQYATADWFNSSGDQMQIIVAGSGFANGVFRPRTASMAYYHANGFNLVAGASGAPLRFLTNGFAQTDEKLRIDATGHLGIKDTTPDGWIDIPAGTTSTGSTPISFTTGTLNSTAQDGALEYTTPFLYFTNGGAVRQRLELTQTKRVTSNVTLNTSTTLTDITGLTGVNVAAGKIYRIEAILYTTAHLNGGCKVAITGAGGATATSFIAEIIGTDAGVISQSRVTSLGSEGGSFLSTAVHYRITGTIVVNVAGTLKVQFAQAASNANNTTILAGSVFNVNEIE